MELDALFTVLLASLGRTVAGSRLLDEVLTPLVELAEALADEQGLAHCYDRYCHDDDWSYCIYCQQGEHDPGRRGEWQHAPDCPTNRARALLARLHRLPPLTGAPPSAIVEGGDVTNTSRKTDGSAETSRDEGGTER